MNQRGHCTKSCTPHLSRRRLRMMMMVDHLEREPICLPLVSMVTALAQT